MENLLTSNNPLHIWSTTTSAPAEGNQLLPSGTDHYGLITELTRTERETYKARYYLVMGSHNDKWDPRPMTFDYETGRFWWSHPCHDLDELGEVYDKETAMKLISHHVINSGDAKAITIQLAPIHIPFVSSNPLDDYQNPYLMSGASTEDVREMRLLYGVKEGYTDEAFYIPKSLGGEFIGYGSRPLEEDEEDTNEAPMQPAPVDVSDLPFIKPEEVERFPDLLRSDWENYNWSRMMCRKYGPVENTNIVDGDKKEFFGALTDKDRALCHWAFHTPLPNGFGGAGGSLLPAQPQFYIITGTDGNGDEPIPLSRGSNAPLTWSRQSSEDIGTCYPIPQVFDLSTAEELVRQQREYDNKRDAGVDAMIMHIIPVCTDPAYVAQID